MDAPDLLAEEVTRTPARGWAVLLLFRAQGSSVILISYNFGLFLPFIRDDLAISPLEAGLLQGVWWVTAATVSLPSGVWFSRFRPVPLVLASLVLSLPFLFMQALATSFAFLLLARFFFVICHVMATPARTLLLLQWAAPRQYAQINSIGLSQHSVILALAVSTSAILITGLGSWRTAYFLIGGLLLARTLAWVLVLYPQGWIIAAMMFFLSATWTAMVTFLPTFWLEERGVSLIWVVPCWASSTTGSFPADCSEDSWHTRFRAGSCCWVSRRFSTCCSGWPSP